MSKDRDLIFDMTEDPEVLTYPAADNEPLQIGRASCRERV